MKPFFGGRLMAVFFFGGRLMAVFLFL